MSPVSSLAYNSEIIGDSSPFRANVQSRTHVRQHDAPEYLVSNTVKSFHGKAPRPFVANKTTKGRAMSSNQSPRTLRETLAAALRRRVGIGKSITPKQLAYALQISLGTIDNLMNGNNDPSGRVLMALLTFFDSTFCNEILEHTGCTVAKINDARAEALRKVAEGMDELRRLG